jgi:hypothetical protein
MTSLKHEIIFPTTPGIVFTMVLSQNKYQETCVLKPDFVLEVGGGHRPSKFHKIRMVSYVVPPQVGWC